jgi:transcriptional regulator with XRE-family HTH domain
MSKKEFLPAGEGITVSPGEMVKMLRELKGWSQNDLSYRTGISQTHISSLENGRIKIGKERSIIFAEALDVHPSSILFSDYVLKENWKVS